MPSPLVRHQHRTAILPPLCYGSIDFYATLAQYGTVVFDRNWRYDKRKKETHRYSIADTHGPLHLTIPIEKPVNGSQSTWNDVKVSLHGEWWNVHRIALESAYGRTPFFEYYIDSFMPFLKQPSDCNLMNMVTGIDSAIRNILGIESNIFYSCGNLPENSIIDDYRGNATFKCATPVEYYQVRKNQLGFIPHLSILDLIFNMGPESPLVLLKHAQCP